MTWSASGDSVWGMGEPQKKIEGLELARFAFAMAVLAYHYGFLGPLKGRLAGPIGWEGLAYGRFAVEAFFVISGYVIAKSANGRSAVDFTIARAKRLWPALILCSTITLVAVGVLMDGPPRWVGWLKAVSFVGMFTDHGQWIDTSYWSIRIEMWFYLAVAALLIAFRRLPNLTAVSAVWLVASAAAVFVPQLRDVTLSPYSAFFIFGLLLYGVDRGERWAAWMIAPAFALAAWQGYNGFQDAADIDVPGSSAWWIGIPIAAAIFAVTAAMRCGLPGALGRVSTKWLGPMTYPLYLLHQWVGYAVINAADDRIGYWPAVALAVGLVLGGALVVSQSFEPWARDRIDRAREMLSPRKAAVA